MTSWGDARRSAADRLRSGVDPATAALDAVVLVAFVAGVGKEQVFAHPERTLDAEAAARLDSLVERRHRGEPVAYLRGYKEFYGRTYRVGPAVLIPRPETETLVDEARGFIAGRPLTVVDVGTGSGAIACSIALHEPRARVIGTDVSRDALAVAEANARALGVAERVELRHGDLLSPVSEPVDVVCANLPYLRADALADLHDERSSLAFEPSLAVAAGDDGLALIGRCVTDLPRVLAPGGAAFFECDPPQASAVAALLDAIGMRTRIVRDLAGLERVVAGTSPRLSSTA